MLLQNNEDNKTSTASKLWYITALTLIISAVLIVILLVMVELGFFIPRKINITIYTKDVVASYTGEAVHDGRIDNVYGDLLDGHELEVRGYASRTQVGKEDNILTVAVVDSQGNDVTNQYNIDMVYGTIEVLPIILNLTTFDETKIYDGTPLVYSGKYMLDDENLAEGHIVDIKFTSSITDVGGVKNEISYKVTDENGNDVTDIYSIEHNESLLIVSPINIEVESGSYSTEYNGDKVSCPEYSIKKGNVLPGHHIEVANFSEHIWTGRVDNYVILRVVDENGRDVTNNYYFKLYPGIINVMPRRIVIKTSDVNAVYDGKTLYDNSYEIISGSFCDGHVLKLTTETMKGVGEKENRVLSYAVTTDDGTGIKRDVTNYYQIVFVFGKFTVTSGE